MLTDSTSVRPCGRDVQMQKCCDASVCQPRQALDQLFIRIEKIVTGRLDVIEISEFVSLRERNGRAGCADDLRLPSIRRENPWLWRAHSSRWNYDQTPEYRAKNSRSLEPRSRRSAVRWSRRRGALSQVQKTTATNEGARVHPALLPPTATV